MNSQLNDIRTIKANQATISSLFIIVVGGLLILFSNTAIAQSDEHQVGVKGFLDEDGDGFNDLIPDSDGDGVPNPIDPDWRGRGSDTVSVHRGMFDHNDTTGTMHHNMMGPGFDFMGHHGEPGMYGPGDSTGHGGMIHDSTGHHHGGWPPPDSGGHGGHGGWPPPDTGGMGPGPGRPISPSDGNKEIKDLPGINGEANRLAIPLRDNFIQKGKNK